MNDYDKLLELMDKYVTLFDQLIKVEQAKTDSVKDYNIPDLEECMKKEQAFSLTLKGYDKKRTELQKQLSLENLTYRQLIPLLPQEYQQAFTQTFQKLNDEYLLYQATTDCAKQMIELNIYRLNNVIKDLQQKAKIPVSEIYTQEGNVAGDAFSFRDIKI